MKTYVVTPHLNCLNKTVLMMGHKISFNEKIWIIIPELALLIPSYLMHCMLINLHLMVLRHIFHTIMINYKKKSSISKFTIFYNVSATSMCVIKIYDNKAQTDDKFQNQ